MWVFYNCCVSLTILKTQWLYLLTWAPFQKESYTNCRYDFNGDIIMICCKNFFKQGVGFVQSLYLEAPSSKTDIHSWTFNISFKTFIYPHIAAFEII